MLLAEAEEALSIGARMIHRITIKNFRGFKSLEISDCKRINVIVGDNGSGKTALLEAIFLALGSSPEVAGRIRQWRGADFNFNGSARQVEEAIWGDLFYRLNINEPIEIRLSGEGEETRSLKISKGTSRVLVQRPQTKGFRPTFQQPAIASDIGLKFEWRDARGHHHKYVPRITSRGLEIPGSEEDLPDFFFFFAAAIPTSSTETASRFSTLSRANQHQQFIELIKQQYGQIEDLSIEVAGGGPALYATLKNIPGKVPLSAVSGAINRMLSILLAIVSRPKTVVIIDEAENGVYFKRHRAFWRTILLFARQFDSQVFLSSHNEEWLTALADEAGDNNDDIALWRMERTEAGLTVLQLPGTAFKAAQEYGGEIR
jgi:ABC-type branched-subunit amino acid transport system ATPase component